MHDFWNQVIFGNPVKRYVFVASAILLGLLVKRILSKYIAGLLYKVVQKMTAGVDKTSFVSLVIAPLETFLVTSFTIVALEKLHFPDQINFDIYEINIRAIVHTIAIILFISSFFGCCFAS